MSKDETRNLQEIKDFVKKYCDERDWDKFHNAKELAIALSLEAGELLAPFRFKSEKEIEESDKEIELSFSKLHESFSTWVTERKDDLKLPTVSIIKYIVSCYDPESRIVKDNKARWTVKKKEAARFSGLMTLANKGMEEDVQQVLYCKNKTINILILRYVFLLHDREALMYGIYNEMLVNQGAQLLMFDFKNPSEVAAAKTNMENIQADIVRVEHKMFSGDDVNALKNVLHEMSAEFMVSELRPESLVTKYEKGEEIVDCPYGPDYEVDKMRFLGDDLN